MSLHQDNLGRTLDGRYQELVLGLVKIGFNGAVKFDQPDGPFFARVLRTTERGILLQMPSGKEFWLPRSVLLPVTDCRHLILKQDCRHWIESWKWDALAEAFLAAGKQREVRTAA